MLSAAKAALASLVESAAVAADDTNPPVSMEEEACSAGSAIGSTTGALERGDDEDASSEGSGEPATASLRSSTLKEESVCEASNGIDAEVADSIVLIDDEAEDQEGKRKKKKKEKHKKKEKKEGKRAYLETGGIVLIDDEAAATEPTAESSPVDNVGGSLGASPPKASASEPEAENGTADTADASLGTSAPRDISGNEPTAGSCADVVDGTPGTSAPRNASANESRVSRVESLAAEIADGSPGTSARCDASASEPTADSAMEVSPAPTLDQSTGATDDSDKVTRDTSAGAASVASSGGATKNDAKGATVHLVASSLWSENIHPNGHHTVWGSWYDPETKRWGFGCCRCMERTAPCSNPLSSATNKRRKTHKAVANEHNFDWSNPPLTLLPREKVMLTASLLSVDKSPSGDKQGAFLAHFIRFAVGAWRRMFDDGKVTGDEFQPLITLDELPPDLRLTKALEEAEVGVVPLLQQLQKDEVDTQIVKALDKMVSLAAEREYKEAGASYIDMTMGRKKWNNVIASYAGTHCQNKGFRVYITKQDDPNQFDSDPVIEKFMLSVKRLVHFVEVIRPNPDPTKRFTT